MKNGQSKPKRAGQFDGSVSRNLGDQKQGHPYYNLAGKGEAGAISVSLNFTFKFRKCFFTLSDNSDVTWHTAPPPPPTLSNAKYSFRDERCVFYRIDMKLGVFILSNKSFEPKA